MVRPKYPRETGLKQQEKMIKDMKKGIISLTSKQFKIGDNYAECREQVKKKG